MPRQARLDAAGVLQHIMARGIERRKIFWDDKDRSSFLERLAVILEETQTQCYAWTLIPNHFHLLLRTGPTPLSKVMRRLMTGYAVTFNLRHRRAGHSAVLGHRKNPLIPEAQASESFSADRRIAFSQFRPGIEKATTNPENPVNPVKLINKKWKKKILLTRLSDVPIQSLMHWDLAFWKVSIKKPWHLNIRKQNMVVKEEQPLKVYYEEAVVGEFFVDLFVENEIIVELKSVENLSKAHEVQLVNYLNGMKKDIGLLINFGPTGIEVKRKYRKPEESN